MKRTVGLTLLSLSCISPSSFAQASVQNSLLLNTSLERFNTVSCDKTATYCIAIGFGTEYHLHERFAYISHNGGLEWDDKPTLLAAPTEEVTPALPGDSPNSSSIDCDETGQQCIVSSTAIIEKIPTPIVYTTKNGGLTWSLPKVLPLPKGINKTQLYLNSSLHTAISCDQTSTICTIAGALEGDEEVTPLIYSTNNAGESWKFSALREPSYQAPSSLYHGTYLSDVSCDFTGLRCVAVGNSILSTSYFGNFYTSHSVSYFTEDGGNNWSKAFVLDTKETLNKVSTLMGVACDSPGIQCTAIGYYADPYSTKFSTFSLTSQNGGKDWQKINPIIPKAEQLLNAISCDNSGKHCVAVGSGYQNINSFLVLKPLVYTTKDSGSTWEKNIDQTFPNASLLNDVFCNLTGDNCLAVGAQAEANTVLAAKQLKGFRAPN